MAAINMSSRRTSRRPETCTKTKLHDDPRYEELNVVARSQQKNNTKLRKRRTASKNKAKNRFFRPQKPPKKFYAAVWRGRKI